MKLFGSFFNHASDPLPSAIERAVTGVEPLLRQMHGYPARYRKPVAHALAYSHSLAAMLPGPVKVSRDSYAKDSLVHALFPSVDFFKEALCASQSVRDYQHVFPATNELFALMGMRRVEKTIMGTALAGEVMQREVMQRAVYFTSHTIESPAATESQARAQVGLSFFDSLVKKVKNRVEARRHDRQLRLYEKDMLIARLRAADMKGRHLLEKELSGMMSSLHSDANSLDLGHYLHDFEEVMLNPERHLRLNRTSIALDRMGIAQEGDESHQAIAFDELIDFDRRDWTVTMVHCDNIQAETFSSKLDKAHRRLAF